ncbi:MAG: response regulator transcription factor [Persicimonas sp.]
MMHQSLQGRLAWVVEAARGDDPWRSVLEQTGLELRRFAELEAMWSALSSSSPAALLVGEEHLTGPKGVENFFEELDRRRRERFAVLPVVAELDEGFRRRLFRAGADDYLVAPPIAAEVRARVAAHMHASERAATGEKSRRPPPIPLPHKTASIDADLSVLVCDDEAMIHRVLRAAFERKGWEVSEALDGSEALELLDEASFDLVVFDLSLPFKNGFELLETLADRHGSDRPWRVVLSAERQHESVLRAFELGADEVVEKPVDPEVLVARIERLLRLGRAGGSHG